MTVEIGGLIEKTIALLLTPIAIGLAVYVAYHIGLLMVAFILVVAILNTSTRGD